MKQAVGLLILFSNLTAVGAIRHGQSSNSDHALSHRKELLGSSRFESHLRSSNKASNKKIAKTVRQKQIHELSEAFAERLPSKFRNRALALAKETYAAAKDYNLDPWFLMAVIKTESDFNPLAVGTVGERGLMQIRPQTAIYISKRFAIKYKNEKSLDNPAVNIRIGAAYWDYLRKKFQNDPQLYISAYNVGPTRVRYLASKSKRPVVYASKVMRTYLENIN